MTGEQAIAYIESRHRRIKGEWGLDHIRTLLAVMGNPHRHLKFIHVAGSNGKGSICAMLDSILRSAGYRVGLYTSPYVGHFSERIRVDGTNIPPDRLASITLRIKPAADGLGAALGQFELITAIALTYFYEEACDIVVLEAGIGGLLDSTNIIDSPEAAVIANIGLEHTQNLGHSLADIARHKAGIIKHYCPAVCYDVPAESLEVILNTCLARHAPLTVVDLNRLEPLKSNLAGQTFCWNGTEFYIPLLGTHQLHNAAVVLETVSVLRRSGWSISEDALHAGLGSVRWPGRMELMRTQPLFLLDGAHNPQGVEALLNSLYTLLPGQKFVFLIGVFGDKDYHTMVEMLLPCADRFICVSPVSLRALPASDLAEHIIARGGSAIALDSVKEALSAVLAGHEPTVALGSLYLAGEIRSAFPRH